MCISGNSDGSDNDSGSRLRQQRFGWSEHCGFCRAGSDPLADDRRRCGEAIQDNDRIIEAINEKLGIDLTVEIVPEANTEKVNVAMASGDFPGCGNWCIRDERNPAVD